MAPGPQRAKQNALKNASEYQITLCMMKLTCISLVGCHWWSSQPQEASTIACSGTEEKAKTNKSVHYPSHVHVNILQQFIREANCDSDWRWISSHCSSLRLLLNFLDDDKDPDQENVLINIPVPPTPRKPRPTKDSKTHPTGNMGQIKGKGKGMVY